MKTALERAEEVFCLLNLPTEDLEEELQWVELSFKEYARDQRHLCAEAVLEFDRKAAIGLDVLDAHGIVMNTKAPGET